jgi:hypothetical protein
MKVATFELWDKITLARKKNTKKFAILVAPGLNPNYIRLIPEGLGKNQ